MYKRDFPRQVSIRSISDGFRHAFSGLWYGLRTQRNVRIHLGIAVCVVTVGLWLKVSMSQ